MSFIDDLNISKNKQNKLAKEAYRVATELGYCDESIKVLEVLGFSLPSTRKKVVIEVFVDNVTKDNEKINSDCFDITTYDYYLNDGSFVDDFNILSVEDVEDVE